MPYATTITDILNMWAELGVFAYLLPFLMIFAMVFGLLNKSGILGPNKGVQATIAIVVGLLSLQFDYVANFFAAIFPYTGIGLAILLTALIFFGLVADQDWAKWIWVVVGGLIFIVIVLSSFTTLDWIGLGYGWNESWPMFLSVAILVGLIIFVVASGGKGGKKE